MSQPVQASNSQSLSLRPGETLSQVSKRPAFSVPKESVFARVSRPPQKNLVRVDPQFFREIGELWIAARKKSLAKAASAEVATRREAHPGSSSSNQLTRASSSSPKKADRGASSPDSTPPLAIQPHTAHTRQLSHSISHTFSVSTDEQLAKLGVTLEQSQRLVISYQEQILRMSDDLKRQGADKNLRDIIALEQSRQSALKEKRMILQDAKLTKYYYTFQWRLDFTHDRRAQFFKDAAERENIVELLGRQLALTQAQKISLPNSSPEQLAVQQGDLLLSLMQKGDLQAHPSWEDVPALAERLTKTKQSPCTLYPLPSPVANWLQRSVREQGAPQERAESKRNLWN